MFQGGLQSRKGGGEYLKGCYNISGGDIIFHGGLTYCRAGMIY